MKTHEMDELDEAALFVRAKGGGAAGERAYGVLVDRHKTWAMRMLIYLLRNESDAEDVAQEAFIRAYGALPKCPDDTNFKAWFRVIATRLAYNFRREANTRRRYGEEVRRSAPPPGKRVLGADRIESHEYAQHLLGKLAYPYREVIILRHVEEMPLEEIAKMLDIGLSAAKMRLSRARKELLQIRDAYEANDA